MTLAAPLDPATLVQRQLDAYNAKDADAWLATYAPQAEQFELHGALLAAGHAELRARVLQRFTEPDLHAQLISRSVLAREGGAVVVDLERVQRNFPQGQGSLELLCIYEIADGLIRKASFASGLQRLR